MFKSGTLMAACVLCRRAPRLRNLPALRKEFTQAECMHVKQEDKTDDQEGKKGVVEHQDSSLHGGYRLYYNPMSYHYSVWSSARFRSQQENDKDEQCLSTLAPSFWQKSSHCSVNSVWHFARSKNTLLDFNKGPEPTISSVSLYHQKPISADVKVHARAYLKCRLEYASINLDLTQRPHPIEWENALPLLQKVTSLKSSMKPCDVSQLLAELSSLQPDKMSSLRSDRRFIMLLRYSVEHLRLFTDLQLLGVLQSFVWLGMPSDHTVLNLFEAELIRRVNQMSFHQLLFAADLWRCIKRKVPQFLHHLYDSVHLNLEKIGVPELVQLLYILGEGRQCPKELVGPVEQLLMCHLQDLYPEEVGTVCLGLFKSQTSLSESAVTRIVDKALSFVEEMNDFAIVNVLKIMRFSYLFHRGWLEAMAREVPRRAHRMGIKGLMHVALACSSLHYHSNDILTAIAERVPSLVQHCRSKDTCKLLWAFGTLGVLPAQNPSLYLSLIEDLRQKKAQFQLYPEHLLTGLLGLAFVAQFPEDLIALALSPDFVNMAMKCKHLDLRKDLFTLDGIVALELPQWTGPRLSSEIKDKMTKTFWRFAQSDLSQKEEFREAESVLQDLIGGEQFVCMRMILPHTRSIDLEVHLDSTGQPIPVSAECQKAKSSPQNLASIIPPNQGRSEINVEVSITEELIAQLINTKNTTETLSPSPALEMTSGGRLFDTGLDLTSNLTETLTKPTSPNSALQASKGTVKLAIQVSHRNHYCCHSEQLLGFHVMKRRQLKLAGYRVVELNYHEWFPMLRKSKAEKLAFLHCKVYNALS